MSDRNLGLFLSGHVAADAIVRALLAVPSVQAADFQGDEAPRVGHGTHNGRAYTHVGLRLFEVGGLLLMDQGALPGPDEVEMALASSLSRSAGEAVFLSYNDESAVGGHARFQGGRLISRRAIDGRETRPVVRDLNGEQTLQGVDASDWVWTPMADAVESGASGIFGPGVRTDDDLEKLITGAASKPVDVTARAAPAPRAEAPRAEAPRAAPPPSGGGLLGRLARKVTDKVRGK